MIEQQQYNSSNLISKFEIFDTKQTQNPYHPACTINICTSSVPSFCSFCEIIKIIIQLLCFETNNIFQQASKPSYSVKIKYKTRLGWVGCRRHPRMKSNHAMPQCIHRVILEIIYTFPVLQHYYICKTKKNIFKSVHYFHQRKHIAEPLNVPSNVLLHTHKQRNPTFRNVHISQITHRQ